MKLTQLFCAGALVHVLSFAVPVMIGDIGHATGVFPAEPLSYPDPPAPTRPAAQQDVPDAPLDLYGNQVSSAVSEYRTDGAGTLYEIHAPRVVLPRLASPTS